MIIHTPPCDDQKTQPAPYPQARHTSGPTAGRHIRFAYLSGVIGKNRINRLFDMVIGIIRTYSTPGVVITSADTISSARSLCKSISRALRLLI